MLYVVPEVLLWYWLQLCLGWDWTSGDEGNGY
jgi:hypothetical protein